MSLPYSVGYGHNSKASSDAFCSNFLHIMLTDVTWHHQPRSILSTSFWNLDTRHIFTCKVDSQNGRRWQTVVVCQCQCKGFLYELASKYRKKFCSLDDNNSHPWQYLKLKNFSGQLVINHII